MKKTLLTLILAFLANLTFAGSILIEGFEYANHDLEKPVGWTCDDNSWLSGYLEKDHNRIPHSGNWYAFSNADDSWMFMQLYLIPTMHYRFNCWAISDGSCQLEFWAGTSPNADDMHTQLYSTTVGNEAYRLVTTYLETIPNGCEYIGIRALTNSNATHLTIDDLEIDMVEQYDFEAEPITGHTAMYPGAQGTFRFLVHNVGYDALDITMHPSDEYFTDFNCQFNGNTGMTFPTQPDEVVEVTITATLRPEVEPGSVCWLDVNMTIPCNCNTAMVTFWVTPLDITQVDENKASIRLFPNPTTDFVTVEAPDLLHVNVIDLAGRTIKGVPANGNALQIDLSGLKSGVYFISAKTRSTSSFVKSILKM